MTKCARKTVSTFGGEDQFTEYLKMKLSFYTFFCMLICSTASAGEPNDEKYPFVDKLEIEKLDGATLIISGVKIAKARPSRDCTKLRDSRGESTQKYYEYSSCEIEGISSALNGIIKRHQKSNPLKFTKLKFNYSVSSIGYLEKIKFLDPEFIEESLTRKISARLSLLNLAAPNSVGDNFEFILNIE